MTLLDEQALLVALPAAEGSAADLDRRLGALQGKPAHRLGELVGCYDLGSCLLSVDHVPSSAADPRAVVRVAVRRKRAQVDSAFFSTADRRRACEDFLARRAAQVLEDLSATESQVEGTDAGWLAVGDLGQRVVERTTLRVTEDWIILRLVAGTPVPDGKVATAPLADLLLRCVPAVAERALVLGSDDESALRRHVGVVEDQTHLRSRLEGNGLVAFVANGSVLPRRDDGSELPLERDRRVGFRTPERLKVTLNAPNGGALMGMGIPQGVTLVVGGVRQGKSTLLAGIREGVYDHVPGDGRERVITLGNAVAIETEAGRTVRGVSVSPFLRALPEVEQPNALDSDCLPASLSQPVAVMEALELGARVLLFDEDTSSAAFLYRDARTQQVIPVDWQPLRTLLDQCQGLYRELGVSTIVATSNPGDYLEAADTVIALHEFVPHEATGRAKTVAAALPSVRVREEAPAVFRPSHRLAKLGAVSGGDASGMSPWLTRLAAGPLDGTRSLREALRVFDQELDRFGLEVLYEAEATWRPPLSRPRSVDLGLAVNRLPELQATLTEESAP